MRRLAVLLMLALIAAALSGCYDARELDDISRVIAIGIDRGVSDAWRVTVQVPTLQGGGESGSDGSQRDYTTLSIDAPSFFDAVEMLNASMLRQLSFSHAQFLAFSEDLARSGRIGEFVAPIIRFGRIRRTANVFVVRGSAMDFVQANEPVIGTSASKTLESLSKDSEEISYFPEATLESFYEAMKESCRQPSLPLAAVNDMKDFVKDGAPYAGGLMSAGRYLAGELPRQGKNKLELFGTAVFVGDKMVETLTGDETRFFLMASGAFEHSYFAVPDPTIPGYIVVIDVTRERLPEVAVSFDGVNPKITLTVHLDGDLLSVQSRAQYEQSPLRDMLEARFKAIVLEGIQGVFDKVRPYGADIFGFGRYGNKNFKTIQQKEAYGWTRHFQDATLTTNVCFTIRRTGTQVKSSPYTPDAPTKEGS